MNAVPGGMGTLGGLLDMEKLPHMWETDYGGVQSFGNSNDSITITEKVTEWDISFLPEDDSLCFNSNLSCGL